MLYTPRWYQIVSARGEKLTLPSVTTILDQLPKPQLAMSMAKNPVQAASIQAAARHRGTFIDEYVKARLRRTTPPSDARFVKWSLNADIWIKGVLDKGELLDFDRVVYSEAHRYAGTLDVVISTPDHGVVLVDVKTTQYRVFDEARRQAHLQCAAYYQAYSGDVELSAIASVFISPYGLEVSHISGVELQNLVSEFNALAKGFGAAYVAAAG